MASLIDKVRIGMALGGWPFPKPEPNLLWEYTDRMESLNIDSIWFTDRIVSPLFSLETIVAMSFIASRTKNLKFGTSVIALPLRNPTILAKELATIDFLSEGRCLPAVGLGTEDEAEYEACGTSKRVRVSRTEEAVEVMRLLWSKDNVSYHGKHFRLSNVTVQPKPVQATLPPIWFGGRSKPALARTAKLGDGWLVSQAPPEEVSKSIPTIKNMANQYGNHIEEDHYGAIFSYCFADSIKEGKRLAEPYNIRRRDDVPLSEMNAFGPPDILLDLLDKYIEAGATKFALRPACPPEMTHRQMELLGEHIIPKYH